MVRAIVIGISGRMGKMIVNAISESDGIDCVGGVERGGHPDAGGKIEIESGEKESKVIDVTDNLDSIIDKCDVVIDFSLPEGTMNSLSVCHKRGKPMVTGTTGFKEEDVTEIRNAAGSIPIVLSPNMSIGVNLLFYLIEKSSKVLDKSFDIEIMEAHHRFKKDAPSGTALKIAQILSSNLNIDLKEKGIYGRRGDVGERKDNEIGMHSIRGGDIVGDHTVVFAGQGERLELVHRANSRDIFARGAVAAAKFIADKKTGLYDMHDVLGLK